MLTLADKMFIRLSKNKTQQEIGKLLNIHPLDVLEFQIKDLEEQKQWRSQFLSQAL